MTSAHMIRNLRQAGVAALFVLVLTATIPAKAQKPFAIQDKWKLGG
jgi:hypothetical protein